MSREYYVQCSPFAVQSTPSGRVHTYLGMDCGSEQLSSGFHYLMNEQAKSLAALHELQNEVGALLEFRDLVIETFPHLRSKMASQPGSSGALSSSITTPNSSSAGMSHIPVPTSRREWEPGIRVKRKLGNKDQETNASSLTSSRSRSNSQGSKYQTTQLMSGNGCGTSSAGSSAVQDSGFGTESKEHYSASSSASQRGSGLSVASAEDELWNLLDVIHRKGSRLRQEVEHLQLRLQDKETPGLERSCERERIRARSLGSVPSSEVSKDQQLHTSHSRGRLSRSVDKCFVDIGDEYSDRIDLMDDDSRDSRDSTDYRTQRLLELGREEVRGLRKERDLLLDRLAEMEAEMLASRARASHLKSEVGALASAKRELEEQLQCTMSQKNELNSRIHDIHLQFVGNSGTCTNGSLGKQVVMPSPKRAVAASRFISSQALRRMESSCFTPVLSPNSSQDEEKQKSMQLESNEKCTIADCCNSKIFLAPEKITEFVEESTSCADISQQKAFSESLGRNDKLGALDGIVSTPSEIPNYVRGIAPDTEKIAAVLKETDHLELQRHLLTSMAENKSLRLRTVSEQRLRDGLAQQLDSTREENDDLKFQLEERNIELEGTRARVRVLEKMHEAASKAESLLLTKMTVQSANLLADEHSNQHHSSSTESAHDTDGQRAPTTTPTTTPSATPAVYHKAPLSPRRRPSKIPLVKSYCAPKPPNSKSFQEGLPNSNSTSISSIGKDTLKRRKESRTAASSPASRGASTPDGATLSWRHRRDSSPSLGPGGRSRDSLSSGGIGRSSSTSAHHGSRESLGGPRSRSTPAKTDGNHNKNQSFTSSSSLCRRELAKSRDSIHSSPGGRKLHAPQLRRNSVNASLNRTSIGETDQSKTRTTRLFSWGNWWKIGILDSPS